MTPRHLRRLKTRIGHSTIKAAKTGCTVLLFDNPGVAGVHMAGASPGTRETDILDPTCRVDEVHGILLTGGSAFGLAAADGVMRYLSEKGKGFKVGADRVPIVPAAVIYDRGVGKKAHPTSKNGYLACKNVGYSPLSGRIGAGCGATVGKFSSRLAPSPGGIAIVSGQFGDGITICVVMLVNAFGNIIDPATGKIVSGAVDAKGNLRPYSAGQINGSAGANTTIGAIVTDAVLTKADAKRVAMSAHDGLAKTIDPSHSLYDGDIIFAVSTGNRKARLVDICIWATELTARAVLRAAQP